MVEGLSLPCLHAGAMTYNRVYGASQFVHSTRLG